LEATDPGRDRCIRIGPLVALAKVIEWQLSATANCRYGSRAVVIVDHRAIG